MRNELRKELDDVPIDDDNFDTLDNEKVTQPKGLPKDMENDVDSGVRPYSKGNMPKETTR